MRAACRAARPASCASRQARAAARRRARAASLSTTGGTRPGMSRAASRSAAASVSVRRAGARPLLGHAQLRQRLLDDQRDARPAHGQHGARDAARQLLDGQLGIRRDDAARDEVAPTVAALELHRGGLRGRPVVAIAGVARGVDRELGDRAAALERLRAVGAHARAATCRSRSKCTRVATAWATAASSHGSTSSSTTVTSLTRFTACERRQRDGARVAGSCAAERDHGGQPPGAALGHRDGVHRRTSVCRRRALQARGDRDASDQRVLGMEARQDGLVERIATARQALNVAVAARP